MIRLFPLSWLFLLLAACSGAPSEPLQRLPGDTLVRLSDAEVRGLDPQKFADLASQRIAMDQFEGLTRFDGAGNAVAGLAESWTVSPDGLVWRFGLRQGLVFSEGTAIRATLFPKLWQRLQADSTASPHVALFSGIAEISAPDETIVDVRLHHPMPQLPTLLAHPAMAALPLHLVEAKGDTWTAMRPLVTSGPYRLADWQLNSRLMLSANPRYHGPPPAIARVRWQPVDDAQAALRFFLADSADIVSDFPENRFAWLKANRPGAVHSGPYLGSYYFAFNLRQPPFDDVRVRRALSIAVDRQWLAKSLSQSGNPPAYGVVPPQLYAGREIRPDWAGWSQTRRQARARQLLNAAGYTDAKPLSFEIRINSSAEHRRVAIALAAMWAELGVDAKILNSEAALHFASMQRGDFVMARSGWIADLPTPENFLAVHTVAAGPSNYSGYADAGYEQLLADAMAEPDPARRSAKMQVAEAHLIDDAPVIPLYYYVTRSLVSSRIAGWQDNASNIHPSATLSWAPGSGNIP